MFYLLTGFFIFGVILFVYSMVNLAHNAAKAIDHADNSWKFLIRCFPFLFLFNGLFDEIGKRYQIQMLKWLLLTMLCFGITFAIGYYRTLIPN